MLNPDDRESVITHDNEISYVLSNFDEDFIYNTIMESIQTKLKYCSVAMFSKPNLIIIYENQFKQLLSDYPQYRNEILAKRNETYENILHILCDSYQLRYEDFDSFTIFTSLVYMYDFLVSNFANKAEQFFVQYIYRNKSDLFKTLGLADLKHSKDISTSYSKKVFKDAELAIIAANIVKVLKNIAEQDIPLNIYISNIYGERIANHLNSVLLPVNDFFHEYIKPILYHPGYNIEFVTNVRLALTGLNQRNDTDAIIMQAKSVEEE